MDGGWAEQERATAPTCSPYMEACSSQPGQHNLRLDFNLFKAPSLANRWRNRVYLFVMISEYVPGTMQLPHPIAERSADADLPDSFTNVYCLKSCTDIMSTASVFSEPGVTAYSQLLFDVGRDQVVVGAR
ncbi:hypothetical protein J6590_015224 [Homalodisca vitripennis]|nr:hypothetical protein J6590_015224 [Homalodisca vitripennis]